ncbi:translation initiation factor eIF2B subunit delta [Saccharomyces paradoxus]|uniref:Translation initiation factor eIF2B subunit delta n=1 Tax=Saccharomyces paradoxus TaxID=27291 RepID=A0A8B8URX1_SACPA|nr:Gcd2 [Saccharomyces paradoxus]QHS73394.1 Gcd2 [Saccharomyces paradoxus]
MSEPEAKSRSATPPSKAKQATPTTAAAGNGDKKLTNKELKELKKQEKAAKRAAMKQANGISIEQQQQQAQMKKEKKQLQREQQQKREQKQKNANKKKQNERNVKKSTLFGHLETTEERRATILALTSAVSSPKTSRITAAGLMVPVVASALSGSNVLTASSLTPMGSNAASTASATAPTSAAATIPASSNTTTSAGTSSVSTNTPTAIQQEIASSSASDIAKTLASISLEGGEFNVIPGISSVIPTVLEQSFDSSNLVSSVKELLLNKDLIHPSILLLTSHLAHYKIVGSIPRCIAMLEVFQIVIKDYQTPKGTTLSRNLTSYLSHQIDLLKKARPLSVTMGNAIRWLKQEISLIDPSTSDKAAKKDLCEKIGQFAKEKIELADQLIIDNASTQIEESTTIVTYGSSKVLTELLLHNAIGLKKNIKVIVVDSRPLFEGRKMAETLRNAGVNVMYALITSLDTIFNMDVDYVFLGAHSILSNGFLYSRAGTAMLAMSAKRRNIPVLVCCESLKFSQRVQLDSVTFNELADPNDLVNIDYENPVERRGNKGALLNQFIKERKSEKKKLEMENKPKGNKIGSKKGSEGENKDANNEGDNNSKNILDGWQELPSLNIVNILYDLTPPEYIKKVITEFGALPPSSVPVILREYKGSA